MTVGQDQPDQPSEEQLRAAYEAELKAIRVEQVLLEQIVSLVNLGMRRTGLAPGTQDERDPVQVRIAIEAIRALLPLIEQSAPAQIGPIRDALSQLQLAFVRIGGSATSGEGAAGSQPADTAQGEAAAPAGASEPEPAPEPPKPGEPGPAQSSGRLWVPGQ